MADLRWPFWGTLIKRLCFHSSGITSFSQITSKGHTRYLLRYSDQLSKSQEKKKKRGRDRGETRDEKVLEAVKYLYILLLNVRLKRSTTEAFSPELTVKKSMLFSRRKFWNRRYRNSVPWSVWSFSLVYDQTTKSSEKLWLVLDLVLSLRAPPKRMRLKMRERVKTASDLLLVTSAKVDSQLTFLHAAHSYISILAFG